MRGQPSEAEKSSTTPIEGQKVGDGARLGVALGGGEAKVCRLSTHFLSQVQVLRTEMRPSL